MLTMQAINAKGAVRGLTTFLKSAFRKAGFSKTVIGLSGGVDSSTSCALTVAALGKNYVYPILLPYGDLNKQGIADAKLVTNTFGIPRRNVQEVNILPLVDPLLAVDPKMDNIRRGNVMARVRMIALYDCAKKRNALVVGTENKTEHLLGYFTRFGDEASDIEPLRNLYKTQVYLLARYLQIPEIILKKPPTAGLWLGQTDEGEFGFTYKEADEVLYLLYDKKKTRAEIVAAGFSSNVVDKIIHRANTNKYKHHLPVLPK